MKVSFLIREHNEGFYIISRDTLELEEFEDNNDWFPLQEKEIELILGAICIKLKKYSDLDSNKSYKCILKRNTKWKATHLKSYRI
jgi:hypothetical protein